MVLSSYLPSILLCNVDSQCEEYIADDKILKTRIQSNTAKRKKETSINSNQVAKTRVYMIYEEHEQIREPLPSLILECEGNKH